MGNDQKNTERVIPPLGGILSPFGPSSKFFVNVNTDFASRSLTILEVRGFLNFGSPFLFSHFMVKGVVLYNLLKNNKTYRVNDPLSFSHLK